jgi:hypothetical protein
MAYAVFGRGMLSAQMPKVEEMPADDIRAQLPRFNSINVEKNLRLRSIARGHRAREERHARPALYRLANGLGLASGSLHHADTWCEIAQAP